MFHMYNMYIHVYIGGLVQEKRNSIANELEFSCTDPSVYINIR